MKRIKWFGVCIPLIFSVLCQAQNFPIPYFTDFENGTNGWVIDTLSEWQLTSPNSFYFTDAYSGDSAFVTNGNSPYSNNTTSILYSPPFDIAGQGPFEISFWHNYNTESTWDGCRVDINLDGDGWIALIDNPNATNWHPDDVIMSSGMYGWSGNSNDWENSSMRFFSFGATQTVQFRFMLSVDASINVENGWAIDDFEIRPLNIQVSEEEKNQITVYPNPANYYITIEGEKVGNTSWKIVDSSGQLLSDRCFIRVIDNNRMRIEVAIMPPGTYFLTSEQLKITYPFIVVE